MSLPLGTCPDTSYFTAAGIPGVDSCTPCAIKDALTEDNVGDFTSPLTASNFLTSYNCIAQPAGTFTTDLITGLPKDYPLYPPMVTTTYVGLNDFFAAATTAGDVVAVACYADTTYQTVANYLYVTRIDTAADNFKCLTCKWYGVHAVTPSACKCSTDTAWAIPPKDIMEGLPATTTAEQALTGACVMYSFDVCAGCGQNRVNSGFIMGRLQFAITNANGKTSVTRFVTPSPTASTTSSSLDMYLSFIAPPPAVTPAQFSSFTTVAGPSTTPFTYGDTWSASVNTGPVKISSPPYKVPPTESANGLYVAIRLTVGGKMCF
ncbi:hypothetical protein HXX76_009675 [Chlamydomonas incerta]|uniref:Uncharacterized protein n=1 Tax=Chlamydomonas incerta TaxID=51695 RepID=A0A835T297_CHLIN|nr:hypothetical protein HXX76_009675 [Chlamydomonas incerta]|eukprot:KAG2431145.1 hypothetical protein HXX76_009675 [Chlamydomonas incerta]